MGMLDLLVRALGLDKIALDGLQPVFQELDEMKVLVDENNKAREELQEALKDAVLE